MAKDEHEMTDEAKTTARLLELIRTERAAFNAWVARVDPARRDEPGVAGEWSLKDVVAHVTWHEREMIGLVRGRALAGSELWNLPLAERNAEIYRLNRARPVNEVFAEDRATYAELLQVLSGLPDAALVDAGQFRDMPAEWEPWSLIAGNTFEHYADHVPALRDWLERTAAEKPTGPRAGR